MPDLDAEQYGHSDESYLVKVYCVEDQRQGRTRTRWRVDGYYTGHRAGTLSRSTFGNRNHAIACADALWTDYVAGLHIAPDAAPETVGDLVDRFLARTTSKKGKQLSSKTTRAYRTQLAALVRVTGEDCPLSHLGKRHVEAALKSQRIERPSKPDADGKVIAIRPLSPRTIEQILRAIRALTAWTVKNGWMDKDIAAEVVYDGGPVVMRPWLQRHEVERLLAACTPSHRIRAGLIIETGLRASEAANLHWSWVQGGDNPTSIRLPGKDSLTGWTCKGKRARAIPLTKRAKAFLREAKDRWGTSGYVLHDREKPPDTTNWCDDTHSACLKAGITNTDTHGLRRTAGSIWLEAGMDIFTVSRLLGHASVTTTEKSYAGLADGHLTAAMDLVDERARR
jgi:integrase